MKERVQNFEVIMEILYNQKEIKMLKYIFENVHSKMIP